MIVQGEIVQSKNENTRIMIYNFGETFYIHRLTQESGIPSLETELAGNIFMIKKREKLYIQSTNILYMLSLEKVVYTNVRRRHIVIAEYKLINMNHTILALWVFYTFTSFSLPIVCHIFQYYVSHCNVS